MVQESDEDSPKKLENGDGDFLPHFLYNYTILLYTTDVVVIVFSIFNIIIISSEESSI